MGWKERLGLTSMNGWVNVALALFLVAYVVYTNGFSAPRLEFRLGVPVMLAALLTFINYPLTKRQGRPARWVPVVNMAFMAAAVFATVYFMVNMEEIIWRSGASNPNNWDKLASILGIIIVIEMCRRTLGWAIPIFGLAFIAYGLIGPAIPGLMGHMGLEFWEIFGHLWLTGGGIFGIAIDTMVKYIFLFLILAGLFEVSGAGDFFIKLAYNLTRRFTGGPALASVTGSAFFGMLSGSVVANVTSTGMFTIPLMKRYGYRPEFAASMEALASSGGQIMPPIMGASAFVMAEVLGIPYIKIMLYALVPAVLYFVSVGMSAYFQARKRGLQLVADADEELRASSIELLKHGWYYLLVPVVLVVFLVEGFTVMRAVIYSIVILVAASVVFYKDTGLNHVGIVDGLRKGSLNSLSTWAACAGVGMIIASVTLTGLSGKLAQVALMISGGQMLPLLLVTMVACLILGMGMTTLAAYLILALFVAPALESFGIPPIVSHMFVFYFGVYSYITPPVCIGSYAAAGLAKADMWKTSWLAFTLAIPGFIVPYMFVYNPQLMLIGATSEIALAIPTAIIGIAALAASIVGCVIHSANIVQRAMLFAGGLCLVIYGLATDLIGLGLIAAVVIWQVLAGRSGERAAQQSEMA